MTICRGTVIYHGSPFFFSSYKDRILRFLRKKIRVNCCLANKRTSHLVGAAVSCGSVGSAALTVPRTVIQYRFTLACPQRNARRTTEEENNRLPKFVMITRFTNTFVTYATYVSWCSARSYAGTPGGGPYAETCSLMPLNNNLSFRQKGRKKEPCLHRALF